jgi:hypothetical protein
MLSQLRFIRREYWLRACGVCGLGGAFTHRLEDECGHVGRELVEVPVAARDEKRAALEHLALFVVLYGRDVQCIHLIWLRVRVLAWAVIV